MELAEMALNFRITIIRRCFLRERVLYLFGRNNFNDFCEFFCSSCSTNASLVVITVIANIHSLFITSSLAITITVIATVVRHPVLLPIKLGCRGLFEAVVFAQAARRVVLFSEPSSSCFSVSFVRSNFSAPPLFRRSTIRSGVRVSIAGRTGVTVSFYGLLGVKSAAFEVVASHTSRTFVFFILVSTEGRCLSVVDTGSGSVSSNSSRLSGR